MVVFYSFYHCKHNKKNDRMLINADDFGKSPTVNSAIVQCFQEGLISRTTIMANMPYYEEAVELSKRYRFFDKVGLHLNLDEGAPLSREMKLNKHLCKEGMFIEGILTHSINKLWLDKADAYCVNLEIEAQMKRYLASGFSLLHIDSHRFVHNNISVLKLLTKLCKEYGFKSMRIMEMNSNDGLLKHIYKILINNYISRNFNTTSQFIQNINNFDPKKGDAEYMAHPDFVDGKLVDIICWNPVKYVLFSDNINILKM